MFGQQATAVVAVAFFKNLSGKIVYASDLAYCSRSCAKYMKYFGTNSVSLVAWVAPINFNECCIC